MALSLRPFTTMKIGGAVERLLRLSDLALLKEKLPAPIRILGNGSNVLIDDRGLKGTVIVVRDLPPAEPEILSDDSNAVELKVSAGIFLPAFARWTSKRGFTGAEYMIGVPGTVGGALVQNAGANEQEFNDLLIDAEIFNLSTQKIETWAKSQCALSYRHSALKSQSDLVVVSTRLRLKKADPETIEAQIEKNLSYRKSKTPFSKPSLGSIFTRIKTENAWLYPGQLIEASDLKGYQIGGALVSPVHANYIVNENDATFEDVMNLIRHIERVVLEKQGVQLQREILVWTDRET